MVDSVEGYSTWQDDVKEHSTWQTTSDVKSIPRGRVTT